MGGRGKYCFPDGPVACKKDLEEVEREADDRYAGNPGQRPLPKTPTKSLKAGSYLTAKYESGSSKFSISLSKLYNCFLIQFFD